MVKNIANKQSSDFLSNLQRWGITDVQPVFEGGKYPAKCIAGEVFEVSAKVFREGHDALGATAVLLDTSGIETRFNMHSIGYAGEDLWSTLVRAPNTIGNCQFYIEGWSDAFKTWQHNAEIKVAVNQDLDLIFAEGAALFTEWSKVENLGNADKALLLQIANTLDNNSLTPDNRYSEATTNDVWRIWHENPLRLLVSKGENYPLTVSRKLSSFCAWYQFFPRSVGAKVIRTTKEMRPGTFSSASKELENVKNMGFDVIYIPPIHPIGNSFKKGKNNSLNATTQDPGSPWAVGSSLGGHDTVNPDLGTMRTFKNFVSRAKELGLEVSLDIALQCSPDHPWVKEHPEWFNVRVDGTIAYAENPPKKYQDIYPLNFDTDPEGIYNEILKILKIWIDAGVTVLRIDNPHTKPIWVWERLIADIKLYNSDVVWLAEAFTLPAMMKQLGLIGYDQSHSYFLWRNNKYELSEFLTQISGNDAFWYRASLWPTTPDNLTDYLAHGGVSAHAVRAVLAAMGSPSWGIYSGYELVENRQRLNPDGTYALEHDSSEKYEIKVRDWSKVETFGIKQLITKLNQIRKKHISCENIHSLKVHTTENDNIITFSRHIPGRFTDNGKDDTLVIVVNLDPHNAQQGMVHLDWGALNLPEYFDVCDEITGKNMRLTRSFYVDLAPVVDVAHIFHIKI